MPERTESALLAEVEGGNETAASATARALAEIFRGAGATVGARRARRRDGDASCGSCVMRRARSSRGSIRRSSSMQFIEDGRVPPERLADYVRGVRRVLAAHEMRGVIFGHAGDAHVHVNPLVDVGRSGLARPRRRPFSTRSPRSPRRSAAR